MMQPNLEISLDLLPKDDFLRTGVCYKERPAGTSIDTLIIHSCYLPDSVIQIDLSQFSDTATEDNARALGIKWKELVKQSGLPENAGNKESLQLQAQEHEFAAIKALLVARRGEAGLQPFSTDAIKDVFEFYGVSAHFIIARDGKIIELVPTELLAFHAGPSKMPGLEDTRTGVSAFSIGIELTTNESNPITEQQYAALATLTTNLRAKYPLKNFYGHSNIAPGRKTDPWNFDWKQFTNDQKLSPTEHHFPGS